MSTSLREAELRRQQRAAQGAGAALLAATLVFLTWAATSGAWMLVALLAGMAIGTGASLVAARRGYVRLVGYAYSAVAIAGILLGAVIGGNIGQAGFFLAVAVVLAAVTLPPRDVVVVLVLGLAAHGVLYFLPRGFDPEASLGGVWAEGVLLYAVVGGIAVATSLSVARLIDDLRRRDEEARAANERAEALARDAEHRQRLEALGRLAGGVAHDFNNLLTVMQGCVSLVRPELEAGTQVRTDLEALADAVDRGAAMTKQLLTFSKRDVVQPAVLDVFAVLDGMRGLLQRMVGEGVALRIEASGDAWPVLASRSQLEQIVMNLAMNARDAMDGRGELWVRVERGTDRHLGEVCRVAVRDTGVGMSTEVQARIFEPFFTTKSPAKGTGLGLATAYGIATRLGGRIEVESEPGKGAVFTVTLPIADGASGPARVAQDPPSPPAVLAVCVVDDEPVVRTLMTRVLAAAGLAVHAFDSAEALLAAPETPCDVLVTDINLPGKSGLALVDELRAKHPALRVLLISGFTSEPAEAVRRLSEGAVFLSKPFEPASLVAAVTAAPTPVARAS
ncbi:MAG: response regulator [Deltaproteobacteria bacterium]|nr:response regulator [Deltaproteobacteria bacterium]